MNIVAYICVWLLLHLKEEEKKKTIGEKIIDPYTGTYSHADECRVAANGWCWCAIEYRSNTVASGKKMVEE